MSAEQDPLPDELLNDFFTEAYHQLSVLEKCVLALESEPEPGHCLDEIFRAAHTLKGAAATVRMAEIEAHTHLLEDVLAALRVSTPPIGRGVIDTLLEAVDLARNMVSARAGGGTWDGDREEVGGRLRVLVEAAGGTFFPEDRDEAAPSLTASDPPSRAEPPPADGGARRLFRVAVRFAADNPMKTVGGVQVYTLLKRMGRITATEPDLEALCGDAFFERVVYVLETDRDEREIASLCTIPEVTLSCEVSRGDTDLPGVRRAQKEEKEAPAPDRSGGFTPAYQQPLRVESRRVDELLSLAGDAVTVRAALSRLSAQFADTLEAFRGAEERYRQTLRQLNRALPGYLAEYRRSGSAGVLREQIRVQFDRMIDGFQAFRDTLGERNSRFRQSALALSRITDELQAGVLRLRMMPLSQLFSRFPRLVRDLTRSLDKNVRLEIRGGATELDRAVVEEIQDPLVHCVRNAVDHGIESPPERVRRGKDPVGRITLSARTENREVVITVEDDGAGIDRERVLARARERGLIDAAADPSPEQIIELLFTPGFSTAETVTRISGRGVGLDVIRRRMEELQGRVSLSSETGKGACFTLRVPLRLTVEQALLARAGAEICAVPVSFVEDSFTLRHSELAGRGIRKAVLFQGESVVLLRPVFPYTVDAGDCRAYKYVVILRKAARRAGLLVDSLLGEQDIIVRPPEGRFVLEAGTAGSAQLADGSTARVLDIDALLDCADEE